MFARGGEEDNDEVSGGDFEHKLVKLAVYDSETHVDSK